VQPLLRDGHQHVDTRGDPDLRLHRVLAGAEERFDAQMLLEPLEKQFHLPSAFVKFCHGDGRDAQVVGQEGEAFSCTEVDILHDPQFVGIISFRVEAGEHNGLIAAQARTFVHPVGEEATIARVAFGPGDEEGGLLGECMKSAEVQIASVEDIEAAGIQGKKVQDVYIVNRPRCDVDKAREGAAKVQERMRFDGRLGFAKSCPREQGQAQIDRGGVEGVDRLVQLHPKAVVGVQLPCRSYQRLGEVGPDTPIAVLVGMGECASGNVAAKSHVIELGLMGAKTARDVPQTLPVGELGKSHAQELVHTRKTFDVPLAAISFDTAGELLVG